MAWSKLDFYMLGFFHGFFLVLERILNKFFYKTLQFFPNILKIVLVFSIVNFLWVFFRSQNIEESILYFNKIFDFNFPFNLNMICAYKGLFNLVLSIVLIILLLISYRLPYDLKFKNSNHYLIFNFITILVILFAGTNGENEFIYFQF